MKQALKFTQTVEMTKKGRALILFNYHRAVVTPQDPLIPAGYRAAVDKLAPDADDDTIISTVVGEVTAEIISQELVRCNPPAEEGLWTVKIGPVEYAEVGPPLPPPTGAQPQVLELKRKPE